MLVVATVLGTGAITIFGCGLLGLLVLTSGSGTEATPVMSTFAPTPVVPRGPTPEQLLAARTLAYWKSMQTTMRSERSLTPESAARIAGRLRRLAVVGVDPEAVECALALADVLDEAAALKKRVTGGQLFMEALVRTGNGDPWGASADFVADEAKLRRRADETGREIAAARARLSIRHGIEFPPL